MTVRRRLTAVATVGVLWALAAAGPALAGGWATVGVDPPPDSAVAGRASTVELTLLQHGRTPLEGVEPRVVIRPAGGGGERTFAARPTELPGVYTARVVFPRRGTWTFAVDDGFAARHSFGRVQVADAAPAGSRTGAPPRDAGAPGPWSWPALLAAAVAGLAAALLTARVRRAPRAALPG